MEVQQGQARASAAEYSQRREVGIKRLILSAATIDLSLKVFQCATRLVSRACPLKKFMLLKMLPHILPAEDAQAALEPPYAPTHHWTKKPDARPCREIERRPRFKIRDGVAIGSDVFARNPLNCSPLCNRMLFSSGPARVIVSPNVSQPKMQHHLRRLHVSRCW